MFRRLMIGLLVVGLVAIFLAEAANAITTVKRRRSVGVTVKFDSNSDRTGSSVPFTTGVFGLPADEDGKCGEVWGELYCASSEGEEARLACEAATGDSAALVVALDPDAIPPELTPDQYNFPYKDFGQRLELKYFKDHAFDAVPKKIFLPAGDRKSVGWFFIKDAGVEAWKLPSPNDSISVALHRYTSWEWVPSLGKYITDDGFGINGEQYISKVPLDSYYGADLKDKVVGKTFCATWHHDQIKGDTLKGNYYGLAAFKALRYDETMNAVEVEIMSATDVCGGLLYNNPTPPAAAETLQCRVADAVVFAPAPITVNGTLFSVDAFREDSTTATTKCEGSESSWECQATVEVVLNPAIGQQLCEDEFGDNVFFVEFIPMNRPNIKTPDNPQNAFTGTLESETITIPKQADICKEGVAAGDVQFSRYECASILLDDLPTCFGGGQRPWADGEAEECCECDE